MNIYPLHTYNHLLDGQIGGMHAPREEAYHPLNDGKVTYWTFLILSLIWVQNKKDLRNNLGDVVLVLLPVVEKIGYRTDLLF